MNNKYYTFKDVMECLKCSESKAYLIMRELNAELAKKGFMTIRGRIPKKYFEERFNIC
jgi:hypothetical protein